MLDPIRPMVAGLDGSTAESGPAWNWRDLLREHGVPALVGLLAVGLITAVMMMFSVYFVRDHLIFFYLFPIAGIAMYYSSTPALLTSIIAAIGAAYFLF